jgi:Leishmanolysin
MKRSLTLLGLFLPFLDASTPFQRQHYVRPAKRKVNYGKSHIPQSLKTNRYETESKTHNKCLFYNHDSTHDELDDGWWYVHVDAQHEHPDHLRKRILDRHSGDASDIVTNGKATIVHEKDSFAFHWFNRGLRTSNIIDRKSIVCEPHHRIILENDTAASEPMAYNVSIKTEYNVSFGTGPGSNGTKPHQNDTSTVLITSSNSTVVNNNSNDDGLNDDTTVIANSTTTGDKKFRFRPLRIRSFLSNVEGGGVHLNASQRSILLQNIIRPALLAWSAALRVDPVISNLTVDPIQLVDGNICGPGGNLPSITVPIEHITVGVPSTDFILYIHLSFVSNQTSNVTSNDLIDSNTEYNSTNELNDDLNGNNTLYLANASHSTSINITKNAKRRCTGDYLAASSFCSSDQFDRPTAGIIHICVGDDFFHDASLQRNMLVVSHEIGHAFGFNAISLAHFRRPNGTPYTDRDPITGEIPLTEINCTGPIDTIRTGKVHLPSSDVLQFRNVRGGVRVAEIVTPSVRQVSRNHFDCQTLPGAELESGEFLPLSTNPGEVSCIGDHWERRLFKTDLMNPLIDENVEFTTRFSTITLAYFADSGWYQVDLSRASFAAGWGRAAGCNFVEQTCVNADDGQVPTNFNSFFCNEVAVESAESGYTSDIRGCTTDLTRKASCSVDHYGGELPPAYQYFNVKYGANVGGSDPFMDYCPVYAGFSNGRCSDSENEAFIKVNYIERFGQKNSRCLSGKISRATVANYAENGHNTSDSSNLPLSETAALCLPIACVVEDRSLRIQVNGVWKLCSRKDEVLTTPEPSSFLSKNSETSAMVSSVICPDPIRVCPTFYCNRDCLGTSRMCDYSIGKCICSSSVSGNASASESNSYDGKNFANIPVQDVNDTDDILCVMSNSSAGDDSSNTDSFYESEETENESELPTSDSLLSDYYYKTERNLKEESSTTFWAKRWKGVLSGSGTFVFLALISFLSYQVYGRHFKTKQDIVTDGDDDSDDILSVNDAIVNPNKDKLMASVVVNLRMHDPNLQRTRNADPLSNRDSETVLSMTDTDGASEICESLDLSLELPSTALDYSGTVVDLSAYDNADIHESTGNGSGLYDDVASDYVDPLAPPTTEANKKPVVRRRRHLFSRMQ